jgi:hypothetical protein
LLLALAPWWHLVYTLYLEAALVVPYGVEFAPAQIGIIHPPLHMSTLYLASCYDIRRVGWRKRQFKKSEWQSKKSNIERY